MPRIKWTGIISSAAEYQRGELAQNAKRLEMPKSVSEMMLKAIPFLIPSLVIIFLSMFLKTFLSREPVVSFLFVVLGFVVGFVLMLVHELLHAVVYPKGATVYIGIMPKQFSAVALASYPMSRVRFAVMSLLPYVLGIVPLVLFWLMPAEHKAVNGLLFGMAVMGLVSPYPDCYNVFQMIRQTPKGSKLQFYEDDLYYIGQE